MSQTSSNLWVNPFQRPPFPAWSATVRYSNGDCVSYAGQNFVAVVINGNLTRSGRPPDQNQISLSNQTPGFYTSSANGTPPAVNSYVANVNGGQWFNLTLATPNVAVWSPTVTYQQGQRVMYPANPPGTIWEANTQSTNQVPQEVSPNALLSPSSGLQVPQSNGVQQYWDLLVTPQPVSLVQPR